MPRVLNYSIIGLEDYTISFESYCSPCEIQNHCKYGKDNPYTVQINCNDLNQAKEKIKFAQLQKLQKKEDVSVPVFDTTYLHAEAAVNFALEND